MPVQDAINFATYILDTTIGAVRFAPGVAPCGGPLQVAAVIPDEGFHWVAKPKLRWRRKGARVGDDEGQTDGRAAGTSEQAGQRIGSAATDRAPYPAGFTASRRRQLADSKVRLASALAGRLFGPACLCGLAGDL